MHYLHSVNILQTIFPFSYLNFLILLSWMYASAKKISVMIARATMFSHKSHAVL